MPAMGEDIIRPLIQEGVRGGFAERILECAREVLDVLSPEDLAGVKQIYLLIWASRGQMEGFFHREHRDLGVIGGQAEDFLAMHEAWRGVPRVHVCQQRVEGLPDGLVRGAVQHEMAHALLHGAKEYYTFSFSEGLRHQAQCVGMDLALLQQLVYMVSIAVKDVDVVLWLSGRGLHGGQVSLLQHLVDDTEEEREVWTMVRQHPVLRRLALSSILKVFLPIWALEREGVEGPRGLKERLCAAYGWLEEETRDNLGAVARAIHAFGSRPFQERVQRAVEALLDL